MVIIDLQAYTRDFLKTKRNLIYQTFTRFRTSWITNHVIADQTEYSKFKTQSVIFIRQRSVSIRNIFFFFIKYTCSSAQTPLRNEGINLVNVISLEILQILTKINRFGFYANKYVIIKKKKNLSDLVIMTSYTSCPILKRWNNLNGIGLCCSWVYLMATLCKVTVESVK